jgi:hypothetical protein
MSSALNLADNISRIPTPPPSYEAPADALSASQPLLPSKDATVKVTAHMNPSASSLSSSNEYEKLPHSHSSHFRARTPPQVLGGQHRDSPTNQVPKSDEAAGSTASDSRRNFLRSQSSLAIPLPESVAQSTAFAPSETPPADLKLPSNVIAHITDTSQIHQGSTSPVQEELSPVHREIIVNVPDLTGRITKEGDYPTARGGFADVWKCVLRSPRDECNVSCYLCKCNKHV